MVENLDVFDFALSEEDMREIEKLDTAESLFFRHGTSETAEMFVNLIEQRGG